MVQPLSRLQRQRTSCRTNGQTSRRATGLPMSHRQNARRTPAVSDKATSMHRVFRFFSNPFPSPIIASIFLVFNACASHTPAERTRKDVRIVSVPPGARIQVNGRYVGDAPVTVPIEMSQSGRFWRDTIIQADPQANGYTQIRAFNGASRWSISDAVPSEIDFDTRAEPGAGLQQDH